MSGNKLGSEGCRGLADMLQYNVTVKTLNVRGTQEDLHLLWFHCLHESQSIGNHIGDKGAQYFAVGLRSNSTLTGKCDGLWDGG